MQPTAVCQSLSHRRTHAEAHAHAHTSAGVAGAPRVFKACTQSGVRVRAGAHVCVSVVLRVCSGCARMRMCVPRLGAFQTLAGMQTSEPLHGFFPPPFLSPCGAFRFAADWASTREAATCGTIETTSVGLATSYI